MNTPSKNATTPRKQASAIAETQSGPVSSETQTFTLPFRAGDVIAEKYEVVGALGVGGVAYVLSALHLELHEMVALKFLRPESLAHEEVVARFSSEARAVARIKNEHVAHVFDVGWLPESGPYIVMEYLEGKDLADVLGERGPLSIKVAVDYVLQACEALAYAHAAGIVHRDIKPENLFLARQAASSEVVKVLDFGISKSAVAAQDPGRRAQTMLPMGTPGYMSPEQIRACATVDARTDIWALGCVLSELLTDRATFEAPTVMQLSANILERSPVPLRKALPEAPPALEALIMKCLEKNPDARFQDVAELATALYPFGPRRARLSVERCQQILHGQDGVVIEFNSVPPPSGEAQTPIPGVATSGVVSAIPSSAALLPVNLSTPAYPSGGMPGGMKPKGARTLVVAGVGLLGFAAIAFALRSGPGVDPRAAVAGQAPADPKAAAPLAAAAAAPAAQPRAASAAVPAPVAAEAPEPTAETEDAPAASAKPVRKGRPARAAARPARPTAAPANTNPQAGKRVLVDDSEPDVGY